MTVPSRPSMEEYINLLKIKVEDKMRKELDGQASIAITSDIWTSDDAPKCLHFSDWPFH
jgi:hypothetical protein